MKWIYLTLAILLLPVFASAQVNDATYCDNYDGSADAVFYQNMELGGRQASVYKTDSSISICNYDDFCERQGMNWYAPQSPSEADATLTAIRAIDEHHTWILGKANTVLGSQGVATWNGQVLSTADSPDCVAGSTAGFSAIRDWGCSMCNPEDYGTSKCWDNGHTYDWIICEGDFTPNNDVPEFGLLGATVLVAGLIGFVIWKRK